MPRRRPWFWFVAQLPVVFIYGFVLGKQPLSFASSRLRT